ncbi:unnamed protein product [Ilex paraguariensis]|uniref:Pectinesterase n=1 Tax=Ilex paraguariensis TaxID=185542 RepID=A0ABC8SUL2_9AQUA
MYGDGPRKLLSLDVNATVMESPPTRALRSLVPRDTRPWHFEANQTCLPSTTAEWTGTKIHCTPKPIASFYRNCVISGTVDFIFGDSSTVIQNCLIIARKPMDNQQNTVTAHGRSNKRETTGLVIQNCRIVPEQKLQPMRFKIPTYLGRPWKEYSRTVIMETTLADFVQPAGWLPWAGNFALDTCNFAEYANRGPGARQIRG